MERRYLAAILAMAATFVVLSNGIESNLVDRFLQRKPNLVSEMKCATRAVGAKLLAKINPSLRPEDLDAARLLAKLNLFGPDASPAAPPAAPEVPEPPAPVQAETQLVAAQAPCPQMLERQEKALRSAERMQRTIVRMQAKLEKSQRIIVRSEIEPVVFEIPSGEEINRQVQMSVNAAQARAAAQAVQVRVATKAFTNAQREIANLKLQDMNIEVAGIAPLAQGFSRTQAVELQRNIDRAVQRANQAIHQQAIHGTPTHL